MMINPQDLKFSRPTPSRTERETQRERERDRERERERERAGEREAENEQVFKKNWRLLSITARINDSLTI